MAVMTDHAFKPQERRAVYRVISERRDMRRFVPGGVVPEEVLARLLQAAHAAPSVGLMQPWRFIRITDEPLRRRIHALVDEERPLTAAALGRAGRGISGAEGRGHSRVRRAARGGAVRRPRRARLRPAHAAADGSRLGVVRDPKPVAGGSIRRPRHGLGVPVRSATVGGPAGRCPPTPNRWRSCVWGRCPSFPIGRRWNWTAGPWRDH